MDVNTLRSIATVLSLVAFIGIVVWAYSRRRAADFEQAAKLPFDRHLDEPRSEPFGPGLFRFGRTTTLAP